MNAEDPILKYQNQSPLKTEAILDNLNFNLVPRQKIIKLNTDSTTILPVSLQIDTISQIKEPQVVNQVNEEEMKTQEIKTQETQKQQILQEKKEEEEPKQKQQNLGLGSKINSFFSNLFCATPSNSNVINDLPFAKPQKPFEEIYGSPTRPPIDLICVVDVSGSMEGQKLKLVKDSLRFIMRILGPHDRISIVTFSNNAEIVCNWCRNTPQNKELLKGRILGMKIQGSTNLASGVKMALEQLKQRKYKNPISLMFLLGDGQDDDSGCDLRVKKLVDECGINETFTINTFGYGKDHDSKVMNSIANFKNGTFNFIENIEKASEYFVLSMSGLLQIFAENVEVFVEEFKENGIVVHKAFGDFWIPTINKQNETFYQMNLNYLLQGDSKQYLFEIELPKAKLQDMIDQEKNQLVLTAHIRGKIVGSNENFSKKTQLYLFFLNQNEELQDLDLNQDIEINYLRAKSGDIIGQACALAQEKKYDQAIQLINQIINEIESSPFVKVPVLQKVLEDARNSKEMCRPQTFATTGQAFMLNKQRNHLQRQASVENMEDWDNNQKENMQQMQDGNLALSACEDNDYQQDAQFDQFPHYQNQFPQQQRQDSYEDQHSMGSQEDDYKIQRRLS